MECHEIKKNVIYFFQKTGKIHIFLEIKSNGLIIKISFSSDIKLNFASRSILWVSRVNGEGLRLFMLSAKDTVFYSRNRTHQLAFTKRARRSDLAVVCDSVFAQHAFPRHFNNRELTSFGWQSREETERCKCLERTRGKTGEKKNVKELLITSVQSTTKRLIRAS